MCLMRSERLSESPDHGNDRYIVAIMTGAEYICRRDLLNRSFDSSDYLRFNLILFFLNSPYSARHRHGAQERWRFGKLEMFSSMYAGVHVAVPIWYRFYYDRWLPGHDWISTGMPS